MYVFKAAEVGTVSERFRKIIRQSFELNQEILI